MKASSALCLVALLWVAAACEFPERTPMQPDPRAADTSPTFEGTYHPSDTMFGHPSGYVYIPGEQTIPYDTLLATYGMKFMAYPDSVGWGVLHSDMVWESYHSISQMRQYYGDFMIYLSDRFATGGKGVLEYRTRYGVYLPCFLSGSSASTRLLLSPYLGGCPVSFRSESFMPSFAMHTIFPCLREAVGNWGYLNWDRDFASFDMQRFQSYSGPHPGISPDMHVYMPRLMEIRPVNTAINVERFSRDSTLILEWESDPTRPHDSVVISISDFANTFPLEFPGTWREEGDWGARPTRHPDITFGAPGPRRFTMIPGEFRRHTPPFTEHNIIVQETGGTMRIEIPPSVWHKFPVGSFVHVRGYRWYDAVEHQLNTFWLSWTGTARFHVRVVTVSPGGFFLTD